MKYFNFLFWMFCFPLLGSDYRAKDYAYLIEKMPKFDKKILEIHFQLYQGYVTNVNELNKMLKAGKGDPFTIQAIKRRYGWEYDGMVLHQLYFDNLGGDGGLATDSPLYKKISFQFGSFVRWKQQIMQMALTRGIGWVILYWNPENDELVNAWVEEHSTGPLISNIPLLVIDLWEHAYLCQFGLNRKEYINTVMGYINWDVVHQRMKAR